METSQEQISERVEDLLHNASNYHYFLNDKSKLHSRLTDTQKWEYVGFSPTEFIQFVSTCKERKHTGVLLPNTSKEAKEAYYYKALLTFEMITAYCKYYAKLELRSDKFKNMKFISMRIWHSILFIMLHEIRSDNKLYISTLCDDLKVFDKMLLERRIGVKP